MAVRRLFQDQPNSFAFSTENAAWATATIAKYPEGKQASAVIPLLWRAQEQEGWVSDPAIRTVAGMLDMAYVRVLEVATFYTMFQLAPVGRKAHIQVCGTTPCMLRGARDLIAACKRRIHPEPHHLSADGEFSWEEVECLGACVNAPMIMVASDTYEDLDVERLERVLDGYAAGRPLPTGPQVLRQRAAPEGGQTSLLDPTLYDGSQVGGWQGAFEERVRVAAEAKAKAAAAAAQTAAPPAAGTTGAATPAAATTPTVAGAAAVTALAAGTASAAGTTGTIGAAGSGSAGASTAGSLDAEGRVVVKAHTGPSGEPALFTEPVGNKPDDLTIIWGVAEKLQSTLNRMGIWHFAQIAVWNDRNIAWFEGVMPGFKGRLARDEWVDQCRKLATGWRPDNLVGERRKP
jgi:NADH-quinone oxidoreductase subunit E